MRRGTPRPVVVAAALTFFVALLVPLTASSMGILMPNGEESGPLAIESHRVNIRMTESTAVTHVDQVFRNSSGRQLEATYVFPLPEGAAVSDFALYINGVRTEGEVLERAQARQIYNNIVRRTEDPGLIEYVDGRIFQASIFPVPANGTQRVELEFAQVMERQGDLRRLVYPLRTGRTSATTLSDFTLSARIESASPVRTVYSPSHEVEIVRESDNVAVVGMELQHANLEEDFVLYLSTSTDDIGIDVLTFDSDGSGAAEGYFLMVVAPSLQEEGEIAAKDVTFVVDTSGSMAGEKIEQARETLRYCVGQLRPEDRFNIVRFSTTSRGLFDGLTEASPANLGRATEFIDGIRARGGTAIEDALVTAITQQTESSRPHMIIFITDGLPTVGETDADRLVQTIGDRNSGDARIFTFGVGFDVDTQLLDTVAAGSRAVSDYVRPDENIELAVSTLYDRIAYPVLTDVDVAFSNLDVFDVFPRELPDLFAGQQLVVTGRYRDTANSAVMLSGQFSGESVSYTFEDRFGGDEADETEFISALWATRKVGYLLDQIRLNGETAELVNEVRNLGVEYGLVTPYTSYLAVDDSEFEGRGARIPEPTADLGAADPAPTVITIPQGTTGRRSAGSGSSATTQDSSARDLSRIGDRSGSERRSRNRGPAAPVTAAEPMAQPEQEPMPFAGGAFDGFSTAASGEEAVESAEAVREMREEEVAANSHSRVQRVGERTMSRGHDGVWRQRNDSDGDDDEENNEAGGDGDRHSGDSIEIRYLSDAYFQLIALQPELTRVVSLGERVEVTVNGIRVVISPDAGLEELDAETEARLR